MASDSRIYLVRQRNGEGRRRLVRASSPSAALKHVVDDTLECVYASQDDIVETMVAQNDTAIEVANGGAAKPSTN